MKTMYKKYSEGQTLILLLLFMVIAITITTSAVALVITNSISGDKLQEGVVALSIAESGGENALLRILRDSTYTGETMNVGLGTATVTVTGTPSTKTVTSTGKVANTVRKVQINAGYSNGILIVTPPWTETN